MIRYQWSSTNDGLALATQESWTRGSGSRCLFPPSLKIPCSAYNPPHASMERPCFMLTQGVTIRQFYN